MNLFEIDATMKYIIENGFTYDEDTGEIVFTSDDLDNLQLNLEQKIENICNYIKEEKAFAESIKKEEDAFNKRRVQHEKKAESLENYLYTFLQMNGKVGSTFETPKVKISFRKSTSGEIYDEELLRKYIESNKELMKKYYVVKEPSISKKELSNTLKDNEKEIIPGFRMVTKNNMKIN